MDRRLEDRRHRLEARRARGLGAPAPLSNELSEGELRGIVGSPLDDALGFSFIGIEDGEVVCRLVPTRAALGTIEPPTLHGGALATCVDTAGWYGVVRESGSQEWVAVDLRIDYLRVVPPDPLRITARCLRVGRRLAVVDVRLASSGEPDRLLAVGRVAFARSDT